MSKYAQGIYTIKNLEKYVGKKQPHYRSSWEFTFCLFCDQNPSVINWASEPFMIPYRHPFTGKNTVYIPDFLILYVDKNQVQHREVIEIKPSKETTMENARSTRDRAAVAVNWAKWSAARAWCQQQGLVFRVVSENDIYVQTKK